MIELPERIRLAELYARRQGCLPLAERMTHSWRNGYVGDLCRGEGLGTEAQAQTIAAILRGDVVPAECLERPTEVYLAVVPEREDGIYVFGCPEARDEFLSLNGGRAEDNPVNSGEDARKLIEAERESWS